MTVVPIQLCDRRERLARLNRDPPEVDLASAAPGPPHVVVAPHAHAARGHDRGPLARRPHPGAPRPPRRRRRRAAGVSGSPPASRPPRPAPPRSRRGSARGPECRPGRRARRRSTGSRPVAGVGPDARRPRAWRARRARPVPAAPASSDLSPARVSSPPSNVLADRRRPAGDEAVQLLRVLERDDRVGAGRQRRAGHDPDRVRRSTGWSDPAPAATSPAIVEARRAGRRRAPRSRPWRVGERWHVVRRGHRGSARTRPWASVERDALASVRRTRGEQARVGVLERSIGPA